MFLDRSLGSAHLAFRPLQIPVQRNHPPQQSRASAGLHPPQKHWTTDSRAIFNLSPRETLEKFRGSLVALVG
jgi:hypothetical protein